MTARTWTIHNATYDLTPWINQHPGGAYVLHVTRGTDCTAMFETSHPLHRATVAKTLARYKCDDVATAAEPWDADGLYAEMCTALRAYSARHGHKASDSTAMMCWYAAGAVAYAASLARWWVDGSAWSAVALAFALWWFAADVLHCGMHCALVHRSAANHAAAACGSLFCPPAAWMRQHVIGHHAAINVAGVDPDIQHHAQSTHGWRTSPQQAWRPAYRHWRPQFAANTTMTQVVPAVVNTAKMLLTSAYPGVAATVSWAPAERAATAACLALLCGGFARQVAEHGIAVAALPFLVCGVMYYFTSQVSHINAPSFATPPRAAGWATRQALACDGDHNAVSRLATLLSIGLNNQAMHHLFPSVHPVHYPRLERHLCAALRRRGIERRAGRRSYCESLANHLRHLGRVNRRA